VGGWGGGSRPHPPTPKPQSPIPNPQIFISFLNLLKINKQIPILF